jgi:hypothetical protein
MCGKKRDGGATGAAPPSAELGRLDEIWPDAVTKDEHERKRCAENDGQQNDPRLHGDCPFDSISRQPGRVTRVLTDASDVVTYCCLQLAEE